MRKNNMFNQKLEQIGGENIVDGITLKSEDKETKVVEKKTKKKINIMLKWICLVSRRMKLRLNVIKAI